MLQQEKFSKYAIFAKSYSLDSKEVVKFALKTDIVNKRQLSELKQSRKHVLKEALIGLFFMQ